MNHAGKGETTQAFSYMRVMNPSTVWTALPGLRRGIGATRNWSCSNRTVIYSFGCISNEWKPRSLAPCGRSPGAQAGTRPYATTEMKYSFSSGGSVSREVRAPANRTCVSETTTN